ncbi:hypothetical protein BDV28DRAFT_125157 [Aspergillus coremiiformis]|uniref:Uncharacterized protein n=1 Tax=Aspergillus coremiiformis TaxID=138285 RepID=A0A5N6Z8T9_9EURO|nr:hypothetical protein BDV28DRAFT_125157 [Aspergillus coremiiformis]
MARGLFMGKPRAPRDTDVSKPVSKYTGPRPRNDPKALGNGSTPHHTPIHQAHWDFRRPRTSDGRRHDRKVEQPGHGFDFRIAVPPAEAIPPPTDSQSGSEENMIGIALGSPRLVDAQNTFARMQETALEPTQERSKAPQLQRKPSKWRKIGGLFKAKNATASCTSQPFYQVQGHVSREAPLLQGSSHSIDYQPREANPVTNMEVWACLGLENKPDQGNQQSAKTAHGSTQDDQSVEPEPGPLLQVDIPSVELERYSVMFSALLNKNEPSLLNRRSKRLEIMSAPDIEASPPPPELLPPQQNIAASPSANSPRLSLFPATPNGQVSNIPDTQNRRRSPSPLPRNQVARAKSRQEDTSNEEHVVFMLHSEAVGSHKHQESESSFVSTTSIGPGDETLLVRRLKPVQTYVDPTGEPKWEMVSKRKPPTDKPKKKSPPALSLNTHVLPAEPTSSESTVSSSILSPLTQRFSPLGSNKTTISPADTIRMPLGNDTASENSKTTDEPTDRIPDQESESEAEAEQGQEQDPAEPPPTIEISIARSVSVSKRKQVLVPVGRRADRFTPRTITPQLVNGQSRYQHGNPKATRVETV